LTFDLNQTPLIGIDASRANRTQRSGIENYSLQIIRSLLQQENKWRFRLYLREEPIAELAHLGDLANVEIRVVPTPPLWARLQQWLPLPPFWSRLALPAELKNHPPDILFVPGHILPPGYHGKSLTVIHDLAYRFFPQDYGLVERHYLEKTTSDNARRSHHLLTVSDQTRQDLIELYPIPQEKITVHYPGCDKELYRPYSIEESSGALRQFNLKRPYFLYIGNMRPKKGIDTLIAAFARFLQPRIRSATENGVRAEPEQHDIAGVTGNSPAMDLLLIGQGEADYVEELKSLATQNLVGQRVHFYGYQNDKLIARVLAQARAYIQPSHYEGFGMPVVEAMAAQIPVLTSNGGALSEVLDNPEATFPVGDATALAVLMEKSVSDAPFRERLITHSKARSQEFSWEKAAQTVGECMERLLEGKD